MSMAQESEGTVCVVVYRVGQPPVEEQIPNSIEALQNVLGGDVERVSLHEGIDAYTKRDAAALGLRWNRTVHGQYFDERLHGDFLITRHKEGAAVDTTLKDCEGIVGPIRPCPVSA